MPTLTPRVVRKPTVLMIEDQPQFRRLIYHGLKHRYRLLEAPNANAAIELVRHEPVDAVLLDLHLPPRPDTPVEGLRARRAIQELNAEVPIVVISSNEDPTLKEAMLRDGVRAVLSKPVSMNAVIAVLDGLVPGPVS